MRAVTTLLLLLMLPGLLLPGGVALHVCLCAWAASEVPNEASCCAVHTAPVHRSCCHRHDPAPAPDDDRDGERVAASSECHCLWIKAPEDRQPAAPLPANAMPLAPPAPTGTVVIAQPVVQHELRTWPAPHSRPPPPGRQRNLPLRL